MSDLDNIDLDKVEDFLTLPVGTYKLAAEEWEEKKSKNNNTYISVKYRVLEPVEYKKRILWENFTLKADFALFRIKRWVQATGQTPGVFGAKQLDELLDKPFTAEVDVEELYPYPPQNRINDFVITEELDDSDNEREDDYDDEIPF